MNSGENGVPPEIIEQISTIKKEVDALQIAATQDDKPWYKKASTVIAATALIISVVSSIDNYVRNVQLDNLRLRDEMKEIIMRLIAAPLRNLELQERYNSANPFIQGAISGTIRQENMLLASRGADIIDRVPDLISTSEMLVIAGAFVNSSEPRTAIPLLTTVVRESFHAADAIAILSDVGSSIIWSWRC